MRAVVVQAPGAPDETTFEGCDPRSKCRNRNHAEAMEPAFGCFTTITGDIHV